MAMDLKDFERNAMSLRYLIEAGQNGTKVLYRGVTCKVTISHNFTFTELLKLRNKLIYYSISGSVSSGTINRKKPTFFEKTKPVIFDEFIGSLYVPGYAYEHLIIKIKSCEKNSASTLSTCTIL